MDCFFNNEPSDNAEGACRGNTLAEINDIFHIPMFYHTHIRLVDPILLTNLEVVSVDAENCDSEPIYKTVFNPQTTIGEQIVQQTAAYYTTDTEFITESQEFIAELIPSDAVCNVEPMMAAWDEIGAESAFCTKYSYIDLDWGVARNLNENPQFLQLASMYNIASPIVSLCIPIIVLILPFFIIKFLDIELSLEQYCSLLKHIIANHAIGKFLTKFDEVDVGQKIYIFISVIFYIFSIYQNIVSCITFYTNSKTIINYLRQFKPYITNTVEKMQYYCKTADKFARHAPFCAAMRTNIAILEQFETDLKVVQCDAGDTWINMHTMTNMGHLRRLFYRLHSNDELSRAITYSFGFNGYDDTMRGLHQSIANKHLNRAEFVHGKTASFKQMYYPKFLKEMGNTHMQQTQVVKNNCKLGKNMIITGPNASGKTTILKTVLLNSLLSQQIGYGCFKSCKTRAYDGFHCYLNIPDTSGRDSLFQAEARRCKTFIDIIDANPDQAHLCIFDELYSGTNPTEAVKSAAAFMRYIAKNPNIDCLLTTHYKSLCKKLKAVAQIANYHMDTETEANVKAHSQSLKYTYKLTKGISTVKGGVQVLVDMQYPEHIMQNID